MRLFSVQVSITQVWLGAIAFCLTCLLSIAPVVGQSQSPAPITLDGRRLFEVSSSGGYDAQERAADANRLLRQKITQAEPPVEVEIDRTTELPVIRVDGDHLLTVTFEDAPRGRSVQEQAQIWATELQNAIARAQRERTNSYLGRAVLLAAGYLVLAAVMSWGLGWLWRYWLQPKLERDSHSTPSQEDTSPSSVSAEIGAQVLLTLVRGAVWLYAVIAASKLFPQTRQWSRDVVDVIANSLFADLFSLGDSSYSVLDLLILIGLLAGLIIVARSVRKILKSRVLSLTGLNRATQETIALVANYGFIFIGSLVLLQLWGLDLSSLTVFAGVLGVGVGLGIQGIAKEFVSGLVLMLERPIQVGDFVEIGELMGTVERISVRSTEIRTLDQVSLILPNSRFLETEVINWSHHSSVSRLRLPVGVAYGSNLTTVRTALMNAAKEHSDVLSSPAPRVFFLGFGDSSLDFELLVWIAEPRKQFQIKSDLYFRIEAILRHRGVEIPFPQRDLHVRGRLPIDVSPELVQSLTELTTGLTNWLNHQSNGAAGPSRLGVRDGQDDN
ncbi:MAG: mechanosensitive ion channel family protein [Cyanophyceae cyanobacterium]